ncbi:DUF2306 domain-containing protein [Cellulomonas sp. McL0617]|uniref:DUF2306 domain-containing protein n=1 Tax=Cellulomonas sp. McL0617 TaxID=3415675 RepID=UPI003CEA8DFF
MTTTGAPPRTARSVGTAPRNRVGWTWILLSSLAIAVYAVSPYLTTPLHELAGDKVGLAAAYEGKPAWVHAVFYAHVGAGGIALVLAPVQFWAGLRDRFRVVHRAVGRLYLVAVLVAGVAALTLAPVNSAGMVGFFGFGTLAILWVGTGWRGYHAIRGGDVPSHQAWMIRNVALTYAAVTLRLWTGLLMGLQSPWISSGADADAAFANAYAAVPFLCFLPNLVVAEWLVRRRRLPSFRLVSPA